MSCNILSDRDHPCMLPLPRALGDAFHVGWRDVLDVGVVGWLGYRLLRLVRPARALQLVVALLVLAA